MKIGLIIRRARERAGFTLRDLGSRIGYSAAQLSDIENDKTVNPLSPRDMVTISDKVMDRQMLVEYCNSCLVRSRIIVRKFPPLNNIIPGVQISTMKVIQKLSEAADALQPMLSKLLNANFREDPDYLEFRNTAFLKILDVQRGAEELLSQSVAQGVITADELQMLRDLQQRLCEQRGHHRPEEEH